MKKLLSIVMVLMILAGGYGLYRAPSLYNEMLPLGVAVDKSFSDLNAQYQRRSDLIPNLVAAVQGEANFEKSTLDAVISARARATSTQLTLTPEALKDPEAMKNYQQVQGDITQALSRLMVASENYPTLQANKAFQELRASIEGTENRVKYARETYNDRVADYNVKLTFPQNIIAWFVRIPARTFFEADKGASAAPQVKFN